MALTRRFTPVSEWRAAGQLLGLEGERIAIAYLTSCGWAIEAHRFRLGRHDLDLIVRRGNIVAFVEVKTRRSVAQGSGLEAVGSRKQRLIAKVASLWCLRYGRPDDEYRFDVVVVRDLGAGRYALEHVPDAWRLGEGWL
jgi:putative endonuclease